jgi:hypothetical protein
VNRCGGSRSLNKKGSRKPASVENSPPGAMCSQAARRQCVELCSIDRGVALATLRLPISRLRGLLPTTSLRRARRNNSMKQTAAPQKLANATYPIQHLEQGKGQDWTGKSTHRNQMKLGVSWSIRWLILSQSGLNTFDNCRRPLYSSRVDPQLLHARNQGCTFDAHARGSPFGTRDSPIGGFQNTDNLIALTGFARSYPRRGAAVVA